MFQYYQTFFCIYLSQVTHETEDGVQAPEFKTNLSFSLQKPSGDMVNVASVYPTRNRKMNEDTLILEPAEGKQSLQPTSIAKTDSV